MKEKYIYSLCHICKLVAEVSYVYDGYIYINIFDSSSFSWHASPPQSWNEKQCHPHLIFHPVAFVAISYSIHYYHHGATLFF